MSFVESVRSFFKASQDNQCQTMVYSEAGGYQLCGKTEELEVDHLTPESQLLFEGSEDPNHTEGMVRCQTHHTGRGQQIQEDGYTQEEAVYGEPDWSRHPDMGHARSVYHQDPESFRKAALKHQEMVKKGERITNDDEGVTEYERERVQQMSMDYCLENDVTPPDPKNHKRFEKHSWTDIFFGTRGHEEDKEE